MIHLHVTLNAPPAVTSGPGRPQGPLVSKMIKFLLCILSLPCLYWVGPAQNLNPHQPYHLTWVVIDTSTGETLTQTSKVTPPNVWFPDLTFDLTKLVARVGILKDNFYVCPGHLKGKSNSKQCRGASNYFCASWSCVSTGNIWWPPPEKNRPNYRV
jgi:hypothetical protein